MNDPNSGDRYKEEAAAGLSGEEVPEPQRVQLESEEALWERIPEKEDSA